MLSQIWVTNLKGGWLIQASESAVESERIRLGSKGQGPYAWRLPVVVPVADSSAPSTPWIREFALHEDGSNQSSFLSYFDWETIEGKLRRNSPGFSGFDALCTKLGLPARRGNLASSFHLAAELPARFMSLRPDSANSGLAIELECVGRPDLIVEWLPQLDTKPIPLPWKHDSTRDQHGLQTTIPSGATKAKLFLCFGNFDADEQMVDLEQQNSRTASSATTKVRAAEPERWKGTGQALGEGGQAHVSLVEDTKEGLQGKWAKKRLKNNADPIRLARFEREVRAVQSINHPNVLKVVDSDLTADRPYFVAEYCERGSLQKTGASTFRGNVRATVAVVLPILDALIAAHKAKIFHRDIKPPNILFRADGSPVIGDFGICFMEGEQAVTLSNEAMGSRNFIAPEMESGQQHLGEPSDRTDVYSLGKVIYWMLSGGKEFAREDYPSLVDLMEDQRFEHVHRLLEQMVVRDPAKRIQSHEVKERLEITAALVEGNFAPLAPSLGIRCRFCGLGKYERFAAYDARQPSRTGVNPDGMPQLGLYPVTPGTNVRFLRCSRCGHLEWFQVTGVLDPAWWDR